LVVTEGPAPRHILPDEPSRMGLRVANALPQSGSKIFSRAFSVGLGGLPFRTHPRLLPILVVAAFALNSATVHLTVPERATHLIAELAVPGHEDPD
jgi:hypothetical protein